MFNLIKNLSTAILKTPDQQPSITIDDGSLKLFEKQISECELSLQTSKQHLAKIISAKIAAKRKLHSQHENITNKKEAILLKQDQGDLAMAKELAEELLTLQSWTESNQQQLDQLNSHEQSTLNVIENTARTLGHYRHELKVAKAANVRGIATFNPPTLSRENITNMQMSLSRLKQRC